MAAFFKKQQGLISPQNLPNKFDLENIEKSQQDLCSLCRINFVGMFQYNCSCCARAVCLKCSLHKMQLSKTDKTQHNVCN